MRDNMIDESMLIQKYALFPQFLPYNNYVCFQSFVAYNFINVYSCVYTGMAIIIRETRITSMFYNNIII